MLQHADTAPCYDVTEFTQAMFAYGWKKPEKVSAVVHTMKDGVPIDMSTTLLYGDG